MKRSCLAAAALLAAAATTNAAHASAFSFSFSGPGVNGSLVLTYGAATDAKYPGGFEVTGISGTISDSNNGLGLVNVPVGSLIAIRHDAPNPTNLLAPKDFSRFAVASGLPSDFNGTLTYDNLFYPAGAPPTATSYQAHGGYFDIYGLMFTAGSNVVDFWSKGANASGVISYGVAVTTSSSLLDYVSGNVAVPEPGSLALFGSGLLGLVASGYSRRRVRGRSLVRE